MPQHRRRKVTEATRGQLALPLSAQRILGLDPTQREVVVAVLARLLLEAAGMISTQESNDDTA